MDDEQLVYLQNLILVSNEAVTDAFGVYEEDQDPVRLAESLKKVRGCVCVWGGVLVTIDRAHHVTNENVRYCGQTNKNERFLIKVPQRCVHVGILC